MCGIAAVINGSQKEVEKMGFAIRSRGVKENITNLNNLWVYFTWLPITDPAAPIQPFNRGPLFVWMNGYISNYKELAERYNIKLETNCDTELLANFLYLDKPKDELNGFFSVLSYNIVSGSVEFFTDRYGIKQLYTYQDGNKLFIASEVKAILSVIKPQLDKRGVDDWLYSLGVMYQDTIWQGIEKVRPMAWAKSETPIDITYESAKERVKELWGKSVERNKAVNVKTGVLLSGGVDSGIIAKDLKPDYSFSVDYQNELSEIDNIKRNSSGTHITMIANRDLFNSYLHKTLNILDDPRVGSCYTNMAIIEMASKYCKVLYCGTGGDEVFNGYTHRYNKEINQVINRTGIDGPEYDISYKSYDWLYLRGILTVEDKIAGAHTIETRYPLLDNDLVNYVLRLPEKFIRNKKILKDISGLSKEVVNGKKKGFVNPHVNNRSWTLIVMNKIKFYLMDDIDTA